MGVVRVDICLSPFFPSVIIPILAIYSDMLSLSKRKILLYENQTVEKLQINHLPSERMT